MKFILNCLLWLSPISLYSQINFEKGYFINNSNEKVECYIRNKDWKNNPIEIEYKKQLEDITSITDSISNISCFEIYNELKYQRFEVNIEKSGDDLRFITSNKNPKWEHETLFLKVLVEGEASLFQYINENLYKYFYKTSNTSIEQLICIKYNSTEKNNGILDNFNNSIKTNNQFRQQLYSFVKCESMLQSDFESIGYYRGDLIKHFTKYNNCIGFIGSKYIISKEKGDFNLKILASLSSSQLTISDPNFYYNKSTEVNGKALYGFGLELEYVLPFNKNKWSIYCSPQFQKYNNFKSYIKKDGFGSIGQDINHTVKINYTNIGIPIGIRHYLFLNKKSKLFINGEYVINVNSESQITFDNQDIIDINSRYNIALGIGYCYNNRFSIETKANLNRELLGNYISWSAQYSTFGIVIGYVLF